MSTKPIKVVSSLTIKITTITEVVSMDGLKYHYHFTTIMPRYSLHFLVR